MAGQVQIRILQKAPAIQQRPLFPSPAGKDLGVAHKPRPVQHQSQRQQLTVGCACPFE